MEMDIGIRGSEMLKLTRKEVKAAIHFGRCKQLLGEFPGSFNGNWEALTEETAKAILKALLNPHAATPEELSKK